VNNFSFRSSLHRLKAEAEGFPKCTRYRTFILRCTSYRPVTVKYQVFAYSGHQNVPERPGSTQLVDSDANKSHITPETTIIAISHFSRKHALPRRWRNRIYMQCATRHPRTTPFDIADVIYVPGNTFVREITLPQGHKRSLGISQNCQQKLYVRQSQQKI